MISLIIVDCQNDFISGTMSVKGAKNALIAIKEFIKKNKDNICDVVFTLDWHPYNHCSFKKYGGMWPAHCVQYTPGACIEPKLLKHVQSLGLHYQCSLKGQTEELEEFGAFSDIEHVCDLFGARIYLDVCEINEDSDVVICGIAGDGCVKSTIQNLINGCVIPKVFLNGIASTDNGETINSFVKEHNLEIVK